jgi:hypothetical protein
MKALSIKELEAAPKKIQWLYMMAYAKQPVGASIFDKVLEEYPEYFPDEIEARRKWAAVPESVNDAYWQEWKSMHDEVFRALPKNNGGILYWIDHPEEFKEWNRIYAQCRKVEIVREKELHQKHYAPYGIEYRE